MSREGVARGEGLIRGRESYFTPGLVARFGLQASRRIRDNACASQVVSKQVIQGGGLWHDVLPHCNSTRARELREAQTPEEAKLWSRLRNHQLDGVGFRRQHTIGNFIVDFCAPRQKLIVELDGSQHLLSEKEDTERTAFLATKGYRVIRFTNHEINENIEAVLQRIRSIIE